MPTLLHFTAKNLESPREQQSGEDHGRFSQGTRLAALITLLAFATPACGPKSWCSPEKRRKPGIVELVRDLINNRMENAARVDLLDGSDNHDELRLMAKNQAFLARIAKENPDAHRNFLFQIRRLLLAKKKPQQEGDLNSELGLLDLEKLFKLLERRSALVQPDGTVKFPSLAAEKGTSLADLTPDDEIEFEALNPRTLKAMGITLNEPKPFKVFRTKERRQVKMGQKTVTVESGTFVVAVGGHTGDTLYKVLVFDGDRIHDSLSKEFAEPQGEVAEGSQDFEKFLQVKMPESSVKFARKIFHENYPNYVEILKTEYEELLAKDGVPLDKHFVYYLQWIEASKIPASEESIRAFFYTLLSESRRRPDDKKPGWGAKIGSIIDKALGMFRGEPDQDENALSYHDQMVRSASQAADIARKKHGPLFAIIRLQGNFFDDYTYNRLSGNYSAKLSVTEIAGQEYLFVQDIAVGLNSKSTPNDIRTAAKATSFAQRLNDNTTYDNSTDSDLRKDLAFSETHIGGSAVSPENFQVTYASDGSISSITLKNQQYNPSNFASPPERLRQIPENHVNFTVGGVTISLDLDNYFDHYHALESANHGTSQMITLYDAKQRKVIKMRNPNWFVEKNPHLYQQIAQAITGSSADNDSKLLSIGRWLTANLDYINEILEINKLTLATITDRGGDCEDGFAAYRTLATSIGLGDSVGGVIFEGHVAPMVRGNHGPTTYNVGGDTWTIVEVAAARGTKIAPGETTHRDPLLFILPDGRLVPATPDLVPLKMVALDKIDKNLIAGLDQAIAALNQFITNPENLPTETNLDKGKNILEEIDPFVKALIDAYGNIAQTGNCAEALSDKLSAAVKRASKFVEGWSKLTQGKLDEAKKLEVQGAPEIVKASAARFEAQLKLFTDNIEGAIVRVAALITQYKGRENDADAMVELHGKLIDIINETEVALALDRMQNEYEETLRHRPQVEKIAKKMIQDAMDIFNKGVAANVDQVARILWERHHIR